MNRKLPVFAYDDWYTGQAMPNGLGLEWIEKLELPPTHGISAYNFKDMPDSELYEEIANLKVNPNYVIDPPLQIQQIQHYPTNPYTEEIVLKNTSEVLETGENFFWPVDIWSWECVETFFDNIKISDEVAEKVRSGQGLVLIMFWNEGFPLSHTAFMSLEKWVVDNKLENRVIYSNANFKLEEIRQRHVNDGLITDCFKCVPFDFYGSWPWFVSIHNDHDLHLNNQISLIKEKKERGRVFLNYNRRPHAHRIALVISLMMRGYQFESAWISLGRNVEWPNNLFVRKTWNEFLYNNGTDFRESDNLINFILNDYDEREDLVFDGNNLDYNLASNFDIEKHNDVYFSIVSETHVYDEIVFFSEKTYKPIYALHPFIIWGNPGSLKVLRDLGYKTFDGWINEAYDLEMDDRRRLEMILDEVNRLCSMSKYDLGNMLIEMLPILEHNYNRLINENPTVVNFFEEIKKHF